MKNKLKIAVSLLLIGVMALSVLLVPQGFVASAYSLTGQKIDLSGAIATSDSKHSSTAVKTVDAIIDGNASTSWVSATAQNGEYTPHWMQIETKSEITLNKIVLKPRLESGVAYYFPKDFTIKVSSDGSNWVTVVSESNYTLKGTTGDTFEFSTQEGIRYIKMEATRNSSSNPVPYGAYYGLGLAEFEAYLGPEVTKYDLSSATATGESRHPATKLEPSAVVDGNHSTSWVTLNATNGEYTHRWLQLELENGIDLNKLILIPRIENGVAVYFPKDFTVKVSANGKNWVTVIDKTDYTLFDLSGDAFIFPTEKGVKFIRVDVTRNTERNGYYGFSLAEVEAYYDQNANLLSGLQEKLKLISAAASSSHPIHPVDHLIDGVTTNIWSNNDLSKYDPKPDTEVVLELEDVSVLSGLTLYPRNHATACNFPHKFSVYLSADNKNWSPAVYSTENYSLNGTFDPQNIRFDEIITGVRYIKLVLAPGNNSQGYVHFAEIEALGAVCGTAAEIASGVEIAEPKFGDAKLTLKGMSGLFGYEVLESSPAGVVDRYGYITYPADNVAEVELSLKIYSLVNESDTVTVSRKVTVKTESVLKVEAAANATNLIPCPDSTAEYVTLPRLDGYTVTIAASDREDVVALDGKITRPAETVGVWLTLQIKDNESGKTAETKPLLVPIYKPFTKPTMSQGEIDAIKENYEDNAYGIFVHYISNYRGNASVYANGTKLGDIDEAANTFDVEAFARSMHEAGAEYVVLTVWHGDTRTLFPSMTNRRWRDERRAEDTVGVKTYSERDIITPLIVEMEKYGIDLHLYTHPCDGHDFTPEDQMLTGWNDSTDSYATWNQYINELYYELCERYGDGIKGLWFDGGYNHVDKARLRATCETFNPAMVLVANTAFQEGNVFDPPKHAEAADYLSWEIPQGYNFLTDRKISRHQSAIVIANAGWWTTKPNTATLANMPTAEEMFKFLVAMSSISREGGFLASTGFYPVHDGEILDDYFMPGIGDALRKLNTSYLTPMKEAILNTNDSTAYPTTENITLSQLTWGVANESKDGSTIYLHVLFAPDGRTLLLPDTADGRFLRENAVIMNYDGTTTAVKILKVDGGYSITLPEGTEWDEVDTVIKAQIGDEMSTEGEVSRKIFWSFDDGVLTITGRGKIKNFSANTAPWCHLADQINKVVIGEGITYIGSSAFFGFTAIDTVNFPNSLAAIGRYAFYGCTNLKSITIPEAVTEIGAYAFRRSGLETIEFGIGYGWSAGEKNFNITEITAGGHRFVSKSYYKLDWVRNVEAEAETLPSNYVTGGIMHTDVLWTLTTLDSGKLKLTISGNGMMADYGTACAPWYSYATDIVEIEVTEGVTYIGRCALYGLKFVRTVTLPETLTAIGDYGFYMCRLMKEIIIPEGVTSIGKDAFTKTGVTI